MITPKNQHLRKIQAQNSMQPDDNSLKSILRNNTDNVNSNCSKNGMKGNSFKIKFEEFMS